MYEKCKNTIRTRNEAVSNRRRCTIQIVRHNKLSGAQNNIIKV